MGDPSAIRELIRESQLFEQRGLIGQAYPLGQKALQQARQAGDKPLLAHALATLAFFEFRLGHFKDCETLAKEALDLDEDGEGRAEALLMLGACATETEDLEVGENYYHQAIQLSRKFGYDRELLRGLHNLAASVYFPRGQFDLAYRTDMDALRIAREKGLEELAYLPLITLSWGCLLSRRRDCVSEALSSLREVASPGSLSEGYYFWLQGELALSDGDYPLALKNLEAARSVSEIIGVQDFIGLTHLGFSHYFLRIREAATAYTWANDAVQIGKRIRYHRLQGMGLIERAHAAWEIGDFDKALHDLSDAMDIFKPLQLNYELTRTLLLQSVILYDRRAENWDAVLLDGLRHVRDHGFFFLLASGRSLALPVLVAGLNSPLAELPSLCAQTLEEAQHIPLPPMRVSMLGGFDVCLGAMQVDKRALRQRRAGELLALLVLEPSHTLTFEQVAEGLWPERDMDAALIQFHHATSALRRALEPGLPEKSHLGFST